MDLCVRIRSVTWDICVRSLTARGSVNLRRLIWYDVLERSIWVSGMVSRSKANGEVNKLEYAGTRSIVTSTSVDWVDLMSYAALRCEINR